LAAAEFQAWHIAAGCVALHPGILLAEGVLGRVKQASNALATLIQVDDQCFSQAGIRHG
jgi:hypothetical protein